MGEIREEVITKLLLCSQISLILDLSFYMMDIVGTKEVEARLINRIDK